jgi:adenylate cyclase
MRGLRILAFTTALLVSVAGGLLVHVQEIGRLVGAQRLELWFMDLRQRMAAESRKDGVLGAKESEIVLVFFDEASVESWEYLSPYPRPVIAELVDALAGAGARTIGLDVYLDRLFPGLNARDGGDDLLQASIQRAGNVVLVAPMDTETDPPVLAYPHSHFAHGAADVGAADLPTPFETIRDGTLVVRSGEGIELSWALALYAHFRGLNSDSIRGRAMGDGMIGPPGLPAELGLLPEEWLGEGAPGDSPNENTEAASENHSSGYALPFPLRFIGPPTRPGSENEAEGTFTTFSASMVPLLASFTPEFFRNKIVLVGTGFHDSDKFRTPFYDVIRPGSDGEIYGWTYGVEVHANALQNLLDSEFVRNLSFRWLFLLLLSLATVVGLLTFWRGAGWGAVASVASVLGVFAIAAWGFVGEVFLPLVGTLWEMEGRFLWIPVVAPLSTIILAYVGSTAYVSIVEGREKRFIRSAFGMYVSPAVVDQIAESPETLKLGGEKRPLTVLFSDLAGFTTLSERLDAEELVSLLNRYLTEMTDIVMEEGGTLDKYIGDAVMAFWNAPQEQPDHAHRAIRCAVRMQRKMEELNERWAEEGGEETLLVRIGVNTGMAVVGNVGGRVRFDYSAIGDPVNLAARLEPANKGYETRVMCSEFTLEEANQGEYFVRELDLLAVKGKSEPVRVFEILETRDGHLSPEKREALEQYDRGLSAYKGRDWVLAAEYFQAALEADPEDGPSQVYLARARECIATPPPADWDFVVRRQVK